MFSELKEEDARHLEELVSMTSCGAKHQMLEDRSTTLFCAFNHPQYRVRAMAVRQLTKALQEKKVSGKLEPLVGVSKRMWTLSEMLSNMECLYLPYILWCKWHF